ncbi:MAG: hypothetical protein ACR2P4_04840 [Gammaproteobacteria bacterium]
MQRRVVSTLFKVKSMRQEVVQRQTKTDTTAAKHQKSPFCHIRQKNGGGCRMRAEADDGWQEAAAGC